MADKLKKGEIEIEAVNLADLSLDELEEIKAHFRKEFPGVKIILSRHLTTRKQILPEDYSREVGVCSRCKEEMEGDNEERVVAGDVCADGKFYCITCLVDDQCGCLPVGS